MEYFSKYSSNTFAAGANQLTFGTPEGESVTVRAFYRIAFGGRYNYSLLFSNTVDSTFSDGKLCHKNHVCDAWTIENALICKVKGELPTGDLRGTGNAVNERAGAFWPLTFTGARKKVVGPGEFFASDPQKMNFDAGDWLCLELTVSGPEIPYHEESWLPIYVKTEDGWEYTKKMPVACMIGCDRPVEKRICYVGDSITQGIGTPVNSYLHWNAVLSEMLGDRYAYWNLGIGYGRANDLASLGAWAYKARQNDVIVMCYGVNDIFRIRDAETTCRDLEICADHFKSLGKTVILQTVPPFNYGAEDGARWNKINGFITETLSKKVDLLFDVREVLSDPASPEKALYGGHPNAEGNRRWAEALYKKIKESGIL